MDAETREALEAVRRFVDGFTSGMKQPDPTPYPTPQQVRSDLARIEQTLRDLSEQRDRFRDDYHDTNIERVALTERVERAERERDSFGAKAERLVIRSEAAIARVQAAEAEAARLREAAQRTADTFREDIDRGDVYVDREAALALLAALDEALTPQAGEAP